MSKPKLYISSTFFDLHEHREALINALRKTERFDIISMENYGTRSTPPLQKCLADVEESEFYILLLGRRYGFIPENEQLSITNLEYKKAIGYTGNDIGGTPDYKKCVLPFILNDNYFLDESIQEKIREEEVKDGPDLTKQKKEKLESLKNKIQKDFTIDNFFTTPDDLTTKVFGALIPELIDRNYADVVSKLVLPEAVAYRCNRESIRNDFLDENSRNKKFYRVFIIHGEKEELPIIFSNNLSEYELNAGENSVVWNIDDYNSSYSDKFLSKLIRDMHLNVFRTLPDTADLSFEELARKIINDNRFTNVVIKFDLYYKSWKEKYKKILSFFFAKLSEANAIEDLETHKNFYLLINIKYLTRTEKVKEIPDSAVLLDKLSKLKTSHIDQWVRTYFFMNTRNNPAFKNRVEVLAHKISDYYFADYVKSGKDFTMEEAIDKLRVIINDFNDNKNIFENYNKLR
jgi:hypothetical protein